MKKVLLIDDDSAIHLIASAALREAGVFQLGFARSGRQGLERARATRPDLILLDHMMPDLDGDQVIRALRADEDLKDTPVLFVTAKGEQGVDYKALGAQGLITKPFEPDKLAGQIREVLDIPDGPAPKPVENGAADAFPSGGSIDQLRRSFVERGVKEIAHLMDSVGPRFDIDAARRLAHLWIGRGGTLGHPRISLVARRLELRLAEGWAPENRWRLQSDLRDVQQAFEEAWERESDHRASSTPADAPVAEPETPIVPAEESQLTERAPNPDPGAASGTEPTQAEPVAAAPDRAAIDLPPVGDGDLSPDGHQPAAAGDDSVKPEPLVSVPVAPDLATGVVEVDLDVSELELASFDQQLPRVPAPEASKAAEPLRPDDLPEDVHHVMGERVVGMFGFDHYATEAAREVLYAANATVKAVELDARVGDQDEFGIDAAVVSVSDQQSETAWSLIDQTLRRDIPTLIVGRGRQLLAAAPPAAGCDVLLAPWSAEEIMLRTYRLVANASARMLLMQASAEPASQAEPGSNRVVIADDDPTITALVEMTLREAGLECHVASAGKEALDLVASVQPAAVVLDVNMPQMNGFEVLATLRNQEATRSLPVVMLTALRQEADVIRGFRLGADDYVIKPFNPMELGARVERLIRRED